MNNLEAFLETVGGKPTSKSSEWLLDCFKCGDPKLYFNIDKLVGYCVKCDETRTLWMIAQKAGLKNWGDIKEFIENARVDSLRNMSFAEAIENGLLEGKPVQADKPLVEMKLPDGWRGLHEGRQSVAGRKALTYLTGRGFLEDTLVGLQFGYCARDYYAGRIIVPTYIEERLVYWQARDFTGTVPISRKILNPSPKLFPIQNGKSDVLFNYDEAKRHRVSVVVESWGSALAVGPAATAVNGKHISDAQLRLLERFSSDTFIVLFDAGSGVKSAWQSAERLNLIRPTKIATLPWGDPNEVPRKLLAQALREAVPYTKENHIKAAVVGYTTPEPVKM